MRIQEAGGGEVGDVVLFRKWECRREKRDFDLFPLE